MSEPFIAEIMLFGGNFAPRGWATCSGQLLAIAQNTALFSLLGTTYGGNGQTNFALPDLRGRVPVGMGTGPGLPNITQGEVGGAASHTLITPEMPSHIHSSQLVMGGPANANSPATHLASSGYVESTGDPVKISTDVAAGGFTLGQNTTPAGNSQPHNNMQPYLGINFVIALEGIFPSRN